MSIFQDIYAKGGPTNAVRLVKDGQNWAKRTRDVVRANVWAHDRRVPEVVPAPRKLMCGVYKVLKVTGIVNITI